LADERPPIEGGDALDFEAAAQRAKAKAQATRKTVKAAREETKTAKAEVDALERDAGDLIRERQNLETRRKAVVKRLSSADRRMAVSETSTPANQERILATYEKHKAELGRIDSQLDRIEARERQAQVAREGPQVRRRLGITTPAQDAARARRLEREATVRSARLARRAVADARQQGINQYPQPIGPEPEDPTRIADRLRRRRDTLRKSSGAAIEEATEAAKQLRQAEGRLKAAQSKARKLRETDAAFVGGGAERQRKLGLAEASVTRAQAPVAEARAAHQAAVARAQGLVDEERVVRRELSAVRDRIAAAKAEGTTVQQVEQTKTTAVRTGAATRKRATADERSPEGDLAELERIARQHNARMAAALDPEGRRQLAARQAPITDPAEQERAARRLEAARAPRVNPPLQPRTAGGGGRDVVARMSELERQAEEKVIKAEQKLARDLERREVEKLARAEAAERVAIGKREAAELEAARAAQAKAAADAESARVAKSAAARAPARPAPPPGTDVVRHPELYGQRQAGPFGRAYRPGGAAAERPLTVEQQQAARSPLWRAQERLSAALDEQTESARQLRRMNRKGSARDRVDAENTHRANQAAVDAARQQVRAIEGDVESRIAHTRAQNAETTAMLANARARGRQPIPTSRALATIPRPGALVRTGVTRDDPYSQLTAAERAVVVPPAPPPPRPQRLGERLAASGAYGSSTVAAQQAAAATQQAAARQALYTQRVQASEDAVKRWSTQLGYANQNLRRHGTFTTEFIDAARKGEVSYREWGWQIGAAATKFGAWTAAGAGIYAALAAVGKIGQGAVQSASGVETLRRTIDDVSSARAQQGFREQAAKFNVPIETVADAQMRMGAVFHDQADAATAASAALYALQTGQVDVEQSTKDLISIQQAYGSSAQDLVDLFDQLNFVQNRYGARIPDMETGIAAASGSFKQMGGSISELVAAFTVLQRHGTTGNIASTIFRRIPNELAKPENQAVLRGAGIDPNAMWPELIKQAQDAIVRGADPRVIAKAITGGQWAARFLNLLNDPGLYRTVQTQLATGQAKGASERELGSVLAQFDQQLKAIGIELGNLGSNLAESGLMPILGTGVVLLRETLSLVNSLLEVFNQLPAPIKTAVVGIGMLRVGLAAARRLSLGEALADRGRLGARLAPYLMENETRRERRVAGKGMDAAIAEATNLNEKASQEVIRAAAAERVTIEHTKNTRARADAALAAGKLSEADHAAAVGRADVREVAAIEKREAAEVEAAIAAERLTATQGIRRDVRAAGDAVPGGRGARGRRDEAIVAAARDAQVLGPPSLRMNVPTPERVEPLGPGGTVPATGYTRSRSVPPPPIAQALQQAAARAAADAEATSGAAIGSKRFRDKLRSVNEATKAQVAEFHELWRTQSLGAAAMQRGGVAANAALGAGRTAAASIGRFAAAAGALIGPEGAIFAAILALPEVIAAAQERFRSLQQVEQLQGAGGDLTHAGVEDMRRQILERQRQANSLIGEATRTFTDPIVALYKAGAEVAQASSDALDSIGRTLGLGKGGGRDVTKRPGVPQMPRGPGLTRGLIEAVPFIGPLISFSGHTEAAAQGEEYRKYQAAVKRAREINRNRVAGRGTTGLTGDQIGAEARADIEDFKAGRLNQQEYENRKRQRLEEVKSALEHGKGLTRERRDYLNRRLKELMDQSDEVVAASLQDIEARYNLLLSQTDDPVKQAQLKVQEAAAKLQAARQGTDKNEITNAEADLNNAQRDAANAATEQAQKQTDALGALVDSGAGGAGTLNAYVARLRNQIAQLAGSNKPEDIEKYAAARQQLLSALQNAGKQDLDTALANARTPRQINRAYRDYERAFRGAARAAQGAGRPQQPLAQRFPLGGGLGYGGGGGVGTPEQTRDPRLAAQIRAIQRQRQREVFEARSELADARTAVQSGNTEAGLPRLQLALAAIGRKVTGAIRVYGRGAKQTLDLIAQQQQARDAVVQGQMSLIQALGEYAAAGQTAGGAATARLGSLQQQLGVARANPNVEGVGDQVTVLGILAQIKDGRKALADSVRQDATDMLEAWYALRESRTDDPVKIARLEAQKSAAIVRRGGFTNPADKMRAQAERNNARRAAQDAAVTARVDDLNYDVEIGKMTTDQEIAILERLLRTHKMGQQKKKEIKQQIGRLKHDAETAGEGDYELGLDNIRLPTRYEIARLVKGGPGSVTAPVTHANTVTVNVYGRQDYKELGRVLEKHVKGAGKATARAAQVR
jgi:TP901 family phage tail tape measure protein